MEVEKNNETNEIHDDKKDIKVPIKEILERCMDMYGCEYPIDATYLVRRFSISGLNLGYYIPENLEQIVSRICSRIRIIRYDYKIGTENNLKHYSIKNDVLYLSEELQSTDVNLFESSAFAAFFEVISGAYMYHKYEVFKTVISYMAGEKFLNMDKNGSRIIMPKNEKIVCGQYKYELRAGYRFFNLPIVLSKQLFIATNINENTIVKNSLLGDFGQDTIEEITKNIKAPLLLSTIEAVTRLHINQEYEKENTLLYKYQKIVNLLFETMDQNYFAFCALILTDEWRSSFMQQTEERLNSQQ